MPVENEIKFVLRDASAIVDLWPERSWEPVEQGYLPGDARVRCQMVNGANLYTFTYKLMVGSDLVEIETPLDVADYNRLWSVATHKVSKLRTKVMARPVQWDIDVFLDENLEPYFAMAECEMPEGMVAPDEVLPKIAPFIAYAVPREKQHLYTNSNFHDATYVRGLING